MKKRDWRSDDDGSGGWLFCLHCITSTILLFLQQGKPQQHGLEFLPITRIPSSNRSHASVHPTLLRHYYDIKMMPSFVIIIIHVAVVAVFSHNNDDDQTNAGSKSSTGIQEVILGEIIGWGGFSFIHEIKYIKLQEVYDTGQEEAAARAAFVAPFLDASPSSASQAAAAASHNMTSNQQQPPTFTNNGTIVIRWLLASANCLHNNQQFLIFLQ